MHKDISWPGMWRWSLHGDLSHRRRGATANGLSAPPLTWSADKFLVYSSMFALEGDSGRGGSGLHGTVRCVIRVLEGKRPATHMEGWHASPSKAVK